MSTNASKRIDGIRGSDFSVRLEYSKTYIVLHLPTVDKFSKNTFLEMQYMLDDWWDFFKTVGYSSIHVGVEPDNSKINRLLRKLNFRMIGRAEGLNIWSYTGD